MDVERGPRSEQPRRATPPDPDAGVSAQRKGRLTGAGAGAALNGS